MNPLPIPLALASTALACAGAWMLPAAAQGQAAPAAAAVAAASPAATDASSPPAQGSGPASATIVFDPSEAHRQAVALARRGEPQRAVPILERLVAQYPQQPVYAQDLAVVSHWAGEHGKALEQAARFDAASAPDYVLDALGGAARALGRPAEALRWYDLAASRAASSPDPAALRLQLSRTYLLADAGRGDEALALSQRLAAEHTNDARVWLARGYVLRQQDSLAPALLAYAKAHELAPTDPDAIKAQVILLRRLGAPYQAQALLERHGPLLDAQELAVLRQDQAAQAFRWGALDPSRMPVRAAALDDALRRMDDNAQRLAGDEASVRRDSQDVDRLAALVERRRNAQAVAVYESLVERGAVVPPYGLGAAAAAYAALRQPERALALFDAALAGDPDHFEWRMGRFYALADAGRMRDAQSAIDALLADTPARRDADNPKRARDNEDRVGVLTAQAQSRAYAEQYADARRMLDSLVRSQPFDSGTHVARAALSEWRGHPRSAQEQFEYVLGVDPSNVEAHTGLVAAYTGMGDFPAADQALGLAVRIDPDHPSVTDALRRQQLARSGWISGGIDHSQDFESRQTLYGLRGASPLLGDHWRPFVGVDRLDGELDDGQRVGETRPVVGLQWVRRGLLAEVSAQWYPSADRTGYAARAEGWLDDQWRVRAGGSTVTPFVALQAVAAGIYASQIDLGVAWRRDESRRIAFDAMRQSYSDGNRRNEFGLGWSERWKEWTDARFSTQASAYTMSNTLETAPYFNPSRGSTLSGDLLYERAGWRHLNGSLWHEFGMRLGAFDQSGYAVTSIAGLRYGLRWRPDDATDLTFGYWLTHRAYDGAYGYYHNANLSLVRRF